MHVIDSTAQQNSCLTSPADTPFSATSALINTTNREAAVTGAPSASFAEMLARVSPVPTPPYGSSSKIDKIRSNMNGSGAPSAPTNVTNQQATHLTSSIKPVHLSGLLALNPGPPSTSSSFSTPSVADSVEFTETNPAAVIDKEATFSSLGRLENDLSKKSDLIQVLRRLENDLSKKIRPHPSLGRLENDLSKKSDLIQVLRRLENDLSKKSDLIQVLGDLKMTYQKQQTSSKSWET
jgi:hypothetical protein